MPSLPRHSSLQLVARVPTSMLAAQSSGQLPSSPVCQQASTSSCKQGLHLMSWQARAPCGTVSSKPLGLSLHHPQPQLQQPCCQGWEGSSWRPMRAAAHRPPMRQQPQQLSSKACLAL